MAFNDDENKKLYEFLKPKLSLADVQKSTTSFDDSMAPFENPTPQKYPLPETTAAIKDMQADKSIQQAAQDSEKIQDSNPGHKPEDILGNDIKSKIAQSQMYGPEQERAVVENLLKNYNGFPARGARAAGTFADALMQGVARAGSGGFEKNVEGIQNKSFDTEANLIPTLQGMNEKQMADKERLEAMTGTTPLGGSMASAYQKMFKQLFPQMSPGDLAALTKNPAIASKIFPEIGPIVEKQIEAEYKKQQLDAENKLREATLASATEHQKAEEKDAEERRRLEAEKTRVEAAEKRGKLGILDKLLLHRKEAQLLEKQMQGSTDTAHGIPDLGSTFNGSKVKAVRQVK